MVAVVEGRESPGEAKRRALARSYLAGLPRAALAELLVDAVQLDVPAGTTVYREEDAPRVGVVLDGLFRVYMTSPEGRQVTVRYAHAGEVLGTPALVGGPVPVNVQAVTDSALLLLHAHRLRTLAQRDAGVAWAMAEEISRRLDDALVELAGNTFGTIRQRVARHLLDLATGHQRGRHLVAPVSQQELADGVGTVREVAARALAELRRMGLVETRPDGIAVLDPARLHAQTWAGGVTNITGARDERH